MRVVAIIPARFASQRFPGKVLATLGGRPVIVHVIQNVVRTRILQRVIVATDDERIAQAVRNYCEVIMTRPTHPSGTDRIAEAVMSIDCDAVINVQADEPFITPEVVERVAEGLKNAPITTAATLIESQDELEDPNVVKVVRSISGHALYFSRYPIPFRRDRGRAELQGAEGLYLRHIGIYGYLRQTLLDLVKWPPSSLELAEKLEQLRALEHGVPIYVAIVQWRGIGIDVPDDLVKAEALLRAQNLS